MKPTAHGTHSCAQHLPGLTLLTGAGDLLYLGVVTPAQRQPLLCPHGPGAPWASFPLRLTLGSVQGAGAGQDIGVLMQLRGLEGLLSALPPSRSFSKGCPPHSTNAWLGASPPVAPSGLSCPHPTPHTPQPTRQPCQGPLHCPQSLQDPTCPPRCHSHKC